MNTGTNFELLPREEIQRMLSELSEEALRYVSRPIAYAYYWTDQRDPDRLTDDDALRMTLVGEVANGSGERITSLAGWEKLLDSNERAKTRRQKG